MDFTNLKVVVFDLDGTLYEDTHHFDYYANCLKTKLPQDKQELFQEDYLKALKDEHTLKIGRVYDIKNDLILVQLDNIVKEAYDWEGRKLSDEQISHLYPDPISYDFETMFNVGDLWWVPNSIAHHYGLKGEQSYEAFLETRSFMMGPEFTMAKIEGFKEILTELSNKVHLVLLTNSPEPDSQAILEKLELDQVFNKKIFNGQKPTRTLDRFMEIKEHYGVDYFEILSVGDNWINEIRPARTLGCKTIYIDPHKLGETDTADYLVRNIAEVIPYLKQI